MESEHSVRCQRHPVAAGGRSRGARVPLKKKIVLNLSLKTEDKSTTHYSKSTPDGSLTCVSKKIFFFPIGSYIKPIFFFTIVLGLSDIYVYHLPPVDDGNGREADRYPRGDGVSSNDYLLMRNVIFFFALYSI